MGKQKYLRDIEQFIAKSPVVSYGSIERLVRSKKKVKQYVKQLLRNLIRGGKLKPLTKGYYTAREDVSLAVFGFQPAYLGLQDALSYHGLWEQETIPIILTTKKVRRGIRNVLGSNVLIRHIDPKYYFGLVHGEDDMALPYSDVEKTLVDLVHFKQPISPEVQKEFRRKVDIKKLKKYLAAYPALTRKRVLKIVEK